MDESCAIRTATDNSVMQEFWLTLHLTEGIGPILARRIIEKTGSIRSACDATASLLKQIDGIGTLKADRLADAIRVARTKAGDEIQKVLSKRIDLITPDQERYPHLLQSIPDPPLVLYLIGTLEPRDLNSIGMVGSRRCSQYGREQAERFSRILAQNGFTVISGGARGIDSVCHRGALSVPNGRTLAVVGSGLDVPYPPENIELFETISRRGGVLSEFPLGTAPVAENFPRRNRIVSGLSRGLLVIEADERSGALITARQAGDEHNRLVMAIPGRVDNPLSAGPHQLIRQGAILITRPEHVFEALGPLDASIPETPLFKSYEERPPSTPAPQPVLGGLSDLQQKILQTLNHEPQHVDVIAQTIETDVSFVLRELTLLSLRGRVKRLDGQHYILLK